MADEMPRFAGVSPGVGLFDEFLHVVFAKQVDGQVGAVTHFFHRAGLAGRAQQDIRRVAPGAAGRGGHRRSDLGDGLGHRLFLCFGDHRVSPSL